MSKYTPLPAVHPDNWAKLMRAGDLGVDVAAWQATLEGLGYDLTDEVGNFGDATHNATLAFQRLRGIGIDGVVGDETKRHIVAPAKERTAFPEFSFSAMSFVQAENFTRAGRDPSTIWWIVLHSMEGAEASTKAETVSRWFAGLNPRFPAPRSSAHYAVDSDSIVQMVKDDDVAWAAPGANRNGLHIEHAGKARQTALQWRDAFSEPMLLLSAQLTARKCKAYGIPMRFVDRHGLDAGERGITTHNEVTRSNLSERGTHTDPGKNFPMDWYLSCVRDAHAQL